MTKLEQKKQWLKDVIGIKEGLLTGDALYVQQLASDLLSALEALELAELKISRHVAHPQAVWFEEHILSKQRTTLNKIIERE